MKTTDNCYVAQIGLEEPADKSTLDYCGPVGFLQLNYTVPEKRAAKMEHPDEARTLTFNNLQKRYLLSLTVGEDYAPCYASPTSSSELKRQYEWNHSVWTQCYVNIETTNPNETYWYLTTDFCYVREVDFWESLFDREFTFSFGFLSLRWRG